ncbi:MAG: Ig-like domain-containing protein [Oscillospiraceae bacterium]|nr:Ig-like domain-containing protein [Oscillospiraceae bacterium]
MKTTMKRIFALILAIVLTVGVVPVSAAASVSLPSVTTSSYVYCYPQSSTTLYTNTGLTKTYKTISASTKCYIVGISSNYVKVRLSASGTTYYAKPSAFSGGTLSDKVAIGSYTATTSVKTYRSKGTTISFGTIDKGDKVYVVYEPNNSEWIQVIYPDSGGKTYYMAWCKIGNLYTGGLTLSRSSATLYGTGQTTTVQASSPSYLGLTVSWSSSATGVATVSQTSKSSGSSTATVTAKTSTNNKTATISAKFYNGNTLVATKTMGVTIKSGSLSLNTSSVTISSVGGTSTLKATYTPTSGYVTWSSSKTSVATVNSSGKVTAKGKGTATITCTLYNSSGKKINSTTATVTVGSSSSSSSSSSSGTVTLNTNNFTLSSDGATKTLTATTSTGKITWTSSDASVATVSSSGVVKAVANGTATITATSAGGKTASARVTVKNCSTTAKKVQARLDQIAAGAYDAKTEKYYYDENGKKVTYKYTLSVGNYYNGSGQCKGYAQQVFKILWGVTPGSTNTTSADRCKLYSVDGVKLTKTLESVTETSVKSFFMNNAKAGDFIQMQKSTASYTSDGTKYYPAHSAIVYSVSSEGVTWLEANVMASTYGGNYIVKRTRTWKQLASEWGKISIYTASNYSLTSYS